MGELILKNLGVPSKIAVAPLVVVLVVLENHSILRVGKWSPSNSNVLIEQSG